MEFQYLEEINGEINKLINGQSVQYILKIRGYAAQEILDQFDWADDSSHVDIFFDKVSTQSTEPNKSKFIYLSAQPRQFYRMRDDDEIIEQRAVDVQGNSHWYSEKKLNRAEFNNLGLENYLSFEFTRRVCNFAGYQVFHDRITSPVAYELITWKIPLRAQNDADVQQEVQSLKIPTFHPFPVFTKFMYVLQCSRHFSMYDELFEESLSYIEQTMKNRLSDQHVVKRPESQSYLWIFGQIAHFQFLYDEVHDEDKVYDALKVMKEQVSKNIQNNIFTLQVVEEREEESFCY